MAVKILQIEGKNIQIPFKNGYYELTQPLNESFEKGILRVAYTGKNRNNTYINKQTFEDAIPTIYNCPIVANYMREEDEIGSHDSELVEKDGKNVFVNITQPVGVVPESAKYWWENIEEDNGQIHEYFCIEIILWKRQECYDKIKRNGITDESMEIAVNSGKWIDGCYHINSMTFLAFCLLGTAEPCFESACVEVFDKSDSKEFKQEFAKMIDELKSYSKIQSKGENQMDLKEVLSKYSFTEEELRQAGFELNENTEPEVVENYCKEYQKSLESNEAQFEVGEGSEGEGKGEETNDVNTADAPVDTEDVVDEEVEDDDADTNDNDDDDDENGSDDEENFSLTLNDFIEQIRELISSKETIVDEWGWEYSRYLFEDVLDEEVIVIDRNNWHLFGVPFSMNGDVIKLAWDEMKRKKIMYEDFAGEDEGADSNIQNYVKEFAEFMNSKVVSIQNELDEVVEKYNTVQNSQLKSNLEAIFEKFDNKLQNCSEYNSYKENVLEKLDSSIEEVENSCYAFVGKLNMEKEKVDFSKNDNKQSIKIGVDNTLHKNNKKNLPYGGIFEED